MRREAKIKVKIEKKKRRRRRRRLFARNNELNIDSCCTKKKNFFLPCYLHMIKY